MGLAHLCFTLMRAHVHGRDVLSPYSLLSLLLELSLACLSVRRWVAVVWEG